MTFEVYYRFYNKGKERTKDYDCKTPAEAFIHCQKDNPGATMVKCRKIGGDKLVGWAWTWYEPPPVQRDPIKEPKPPPKLLKPDDKSCVLPFYDDAISSRTGRV